MTNQPTPVILDDEQLQKIEARPYYYVGLGRRVELHPDERDALCATVRAAWRDRDRALTPSIVESLRLLDDAGYGKEVPNSMSEMIKKALTENTALREQLAARTIELERESHEMQKWNNRANQLAIEGQELRQRLAQVEKERDHYKRLYEL